MQSSPSQQQPRVPDGGWGWYILIAAATSNFLMAGINKSISITIVEVVNELGFNPSQASGIPAIATFTYLSSSPLTVMLCSHFSFKLVAMGGAFLSVSGIILSGYATGSIYLQYLGIGVLHGVGSGMIFTAGFVCVGTYFDRYKGFCNAICLAANSLGGMIVPFLLTFLYDKYGYSGAHLIMGGLLMNCFACPMFYHPVERHMKPGKVMQPIEPLSPVAPLLVTNELDDNQNSFILSRDSSFASGSSVSSGLYFADSTYNTVTQNNIKNKGKTADLQMISSSPLKKEVFPPIASMWQSGAIQENTASGNLKGDEKSQEEFLQMPVLREGGKRSRLTSLSSVAESLSSLRMSNVYLGSSINVLEEEASRRVKHIQKRHRFVSETIAEDNNKPSSSHLQTEPEKALESIEDGSSALRSPSQNKSKKKIFDLNVLKNTKYLLILISSLTITLSYNNFLQFLPSYSIIELGWDKESVNLLILTTNGFDLAGRFLSAILANYLRFPALYLYMSTVAISGVLEISFGFNTQYVIFIVVSGFFGLVSGLHIGIMPVVQEEELGAGVLQYSITIQYFSQALISLVSPVLATILADEMGTYGLVYVVFGLSLIIIGAGVFVFYPLAVKRENNKDRAEKIEEEAGKTKLEAEEKP